MASIQQSTLGLGGINVEIAESGTGRPVVFLHSGDGLAHCEPFLGRMASACRVIAPSHPGFGHSDLPAQFHAIDDLAYFYLDLFAQMKLQQAVLVGASFGGWIAAEIAIRSTANISHLVLVDAVGIRHSKDETAVEIQDIFTLHPEELDRRAYVEPARWKKGPDACTDDELFVMARNRESLALFGWSPYMYNPLLARWLHRIGVPTMVLWGEKDGIVSPDYGRAYAAAIPGARFDLIRGAAHHPAVEQPEAVASAVAKFAGITLA